MKILVKNYLDLDKTQSDEILKIRNLKHIVNASLNQNEITKSQHENFIISLKNSKNSHYFAIFSDDEIIGGVHFVLKNEPTWGLFFKPNTNAILISAITLKFLEFCFKRCEILNASVKKQNENALKFDKNFGFKITSSDDNFYHLSQRKDEFYSHLKTELMQKIAKIADEFMISFDDLS